MVHIQTSELIVVRWSQYIIKDDCLKNYWLFIFNWGFCFIKWKGFFFFFFFLCSQDSCDSSLLFFPLSLSLSNSSSIPDSCFHIIVGNSLDIFILCFS